MRRLHLAPLALVAFLVSTSPAHATLITFTLDTEFSGASTPSGFPTVSFDDFGLTGSVLLTITTNLSGSEFINDVYLNYTGDPTALSFAYSSGTPAIGFSTGSNSFKADGDGFFDILVNYPPPGMPSFGAGDTSAYLITLAGLTASDFNVSSFCSAGCGNGSFFAAAHIGGIGGDGNLSGWMGDGTGPGTPGPGPGPGGGQVPEAASLVMLGVGLAFAARQYRRR